jgi:hypothetical protein
MRGIGGDGVMNEHHWRQQIGILSWAARRHGGTVVRRIRPVGPQSAPGHGRVGVLARAHPAEGASIATNPGAVSPNRGGNAPTDRIGWSIRGVDRAIHGQVRKRLEAHVVIGALTVVYAAKSQTTQIPGDGWGVVVRRSGGPRRPGGSRRPGGPRRPGGLGGPAARRCECCA